jgi:hypothetical protein
MPYVEPSVRHPTFEASRASAGASFSVPAGKLVAAE